MEVTKDDDKAEIKKGDLAKMKITHILWTFGIGGIQTMLVDIVNEQINFCQVEILVVNNRVDEGLKAKLDKRISLYCFDRVPGSYSPIPIIRLNLHLLKSKPSLVHCHEDGITKVLYYKVPMVRTIHNTHSYPDEFHKFKCLCCISEAVKKRTQEQGFDNGIVVYNGIQTESIETKEDYIYRGNDLTKIVCVGRLHPMKGQTILIDAINILVNERLRQNIIIDLIGDGPSKSELEEHVKQLNLEDYIHFVGVKSRNYIYGHLKDYNLFVMPSTCEGFGLTLAEACAAKVPVITSDLEGPMEVIDYGEYGRFYESGDAESLADAIDSYLLGGVNVEQIEGAYSFVKCMFNVKNTASHYYKIYLNILKNGE